MGVGGECRRIITSPLTVLSTKVTQTDSVHKHHNDMHTFTQAGAILVKTCCLAKDVTMGEIRNCVEHRAALSYVMCTFNPQLQLPARCFGLGFVPELRCVSSTL